MSLGSSVVEHSAENAGVGSSILPPGICGCHITVIIRPCQGRNGGSTPLTRFGHVAEWLRSGLQNRVHRFNSGRGLEFCRGGGIGIRDGLKIRWW